MTTLDLLTTTEVALALGVTRQAVLQRVESGTLVPSMKLPGLRGAYLFDPSDVCPTDAAS